MKVDFSDKVVGGFTYEFVRGLSAQDVGAAEFGECLETIAKVANNDFESWTREWSALADRVFAHAEWESRWGTCAAAGNAFLRASNYYRMAVFYVEHTDPRHTRLWQRSRESFHRVIDHQDRPVERVAIDFEGAKLPGYFASGGAGRRPTLIALGGFDSTMEEVYTWIGAAAADYGWHCLVFEGPGQWGALKDNPGLRFRPDYEKPVGAAVDHLLSRADVDGERIALIGYSMGGYLAPRGALDQRIKACVPNSLVVDCGAAARVSMKRLVRSEWLMDTALTLAMKLNTPARWGFQHSRWTLGVESAREWVEAYRDFTIRNLADRYRNPMLFLFGEDDIVNDSVPPAVLVDVLDWVLELPCDRAVRLFTREEGASSHCQMGGMAYARSAVFGWLDHVLGDAPLPPTHDPRSPELFVELFARHCGREGAARARAVVEVARFL